MKFVNSVINDFESIEHDPVIYLIILDQNRLF